ncbi:MAG: cyclic nucleotide-binding domain-containing protein [Candidatus Brocadiaceae bacterium]|nr:cyclic nucleotide-binding domain-containing protein [Candidatus Brocadiaceae bacterium]
MSGFAFAAFIMGIISACSLPLGTITSAFWKPTDRMLAFLMAFGGGALLAALTIDLVGSALERGEFLSVALGCFTGGLLFVALNQIINNHGGFLRKSSTTIYYLQRQRRIRFQRVLSHIGLLPVFKDLPRDEVRRLAASVISREYPKGSTLYRRNDPGERLYIIEEGEVELLDPRQDMRPFRTLRRNDSFGRMAFLTGAPYQTVAVTKTDIRVWTLERDEFNKCLLSSPRLKNTLQSFLCEPVIFRYLQERHGMDDKTARGWISSAVENLNKEGVLLSAVSPERRGEEFRHIINKVRRFPFFHDLGPSDIEEIASRLFCKRHEKGHTFFLQNEYADRMYIIEQGEVALIDPGNRTRALMTLHAHDAFGAMAFLTGTCHTVNAIAMDDTTVWVLRRREFKELLSKSRGLSQAVQDFLQREEMHTYLEAKQDLSHEKAVEWSRKAIHSLNAGGIVPSASEMAQAVRQHKGAPFVILLGIMLDGIPESLVIGSSMVHSHLSLSLLAGLFLSNYPESLSSSVGMKEQGYSFKKILALWSSLTIFTGVGSALGSIFFREAPPFLFYLVEGIAAGSMLTMVAETMLPEAYFKGGSVVGLSTLLGFLTAIFFKTLE